MDNYELFYEECEQLRLLLALEIENSIFEQIYPHMNEEDTFNSHQIKQVKYPEFIFAHKDKQFEFWDIDFLEKRGMEQICSDIEQARNHRVLIKDRQIKEPSIIIIPVLQKAELIDDIYILLMNLARISHNDDNTHNDKCLIKLQKKIGEASILYDNDIDISNHLQEIFHLHILTIKSNFFYCKTAFHPIWNLHYVSKYIVEFLFHRDYCQWRVNNIYYKDWHQGYYNFIKSPQLSTKEYYLQSHFWFYYLFVDNIEDGLFFILYLREITNSKSRKVIDYFLSRFHSLNELNAVMDRYKNKNEIKKKLSSSHNTTTIIPDSYDYKINKYAFDQIISLLIDDNNFFKEKTKQKSDKEMLIHELYIHIQTATDMTPLIKKYNIKKGRFGYFITIIRDHILYEEEKKKEEWFKTVGKYFGENYKDICANPRGETSWKSKFAADCKKALKGQANSKIED